MNWLPSLRQLVPIAIGVVVLMAVADFLGFTSYILSPVSAFKNRGVTG